MSHPPETKLTSRELADRIYATCVYGSPGTVHFRNADATALIDAWVRVRELEARLLQAEGMTAEWNESVSSYTWMTKEVARLELALATARKQLKGATHGQAEVPSAAASADSEPGGA